MGDVTLTAAVRQNLLSLQSTSDLIAQTQNRLSTGLRVASPLDDAVSYFQAKGLNDRATDFTEKKDGIDQGISTLTAATDAITAVEALVRQLKGLAVNLKSAATNSEVANIVTQYNDIRDQIGLLTSDSTYQGLDLVNGSGSILTVQFSNDTASTLAVNSVDLRADENYTGGTGLAIAKLSVATQTFNLNRAFVSAGTISAAGSGGLSQAETISFAVGGQTAQSISSGDTFTVVYGGSTLTLNVITENNVQSAGGDKVIISAGTYAIGTTIKIAVLTDAAVTGSTIPDGSFASVVIGATSFTLLESQAVRTVGIGYTTELNARLAALDTDLATLRSNAKTLGSNVAILITRLDFTTNYVDTLTAGAGKLTLADLNEEGANTLALQTRQQLGVQSLAFAGQTEQSILGLFR